MSSVDKALDILMLLASDVRPVGVREIGRRLGLTPPTVHRLLHSMVAHDLVQQVDVTGEYRLGWACLELSRSVLGGSELAQVAPPVARELRDMTGETVTAQVRVGREQVVVAEAEGTHELRRRVGVGRRSPLHAGASGRAILAHLQPAEIDAYLADQLTEVGPNTPTDAARLRELIAGVRADGYAISHQETVAGVTALSVPVFGEDGLIRGSLSISGPDTRMEPDLISRFVPLLQGAGRSLSSAMGYRGDRVPRDLAIA